MRPATLPALLLFENMCAFLPHHSACVASQLRRACEATADELASVTGDRSALRNELDQAQLSIDALATELQETVDKAQAGEAKAAELEAQLQESEQACSLAQQQVWAGTHAWACCTTHKVQCSMIVWHAG